VCGIAGYTGAAPPDEPAVQWCLRLMKRRGPDAAGVVRELTTSGESLLLLHSRLAILDRHDRANQPMRRGQHLLAMNGQLFNYREIRDCLTREGHAFSTESDTEVLLAQLSENGLEGLDACEGMWAFAWHRRGGPLVLCRDRFGEKPLYLLRVDHGVYWGSEIKFIRALAREPVTPDTKQIQRYLARGYKFVCGRSRTFWSGVSELEPGTALVIHGRSDMEPLHYWRPAFETDENMTLDEAVDGVGLRLREAVRIRLRADAPIAFCMSSGVDSNSLIGLARSLHQSDMHGFTIASHDGRYDEADGAINLARQAGIRHTMMRPSAGEFLDGMCTLARHHDAPVLTVSYYLHWLLMRTIASEGYRVVISGTGADELLTGYLDHHLLWLESQRGRPEHALHVKAWEKNIAPLVRNADLLNPRLYRDQDRANPALESERRLAESYLHDPEDDPVPDCCYTSDGLRNRMLNELFLQVVPAILHEDDLNAMYYSMENRSPFLDRQLAEFCFKIPTQHLMKDAYTKYPLRAAMRGQVHSDALWNRRKVGFNGSTRELLDPKSPAVTATILDTPAVFDFVQRDKVEALLAKESHTDAENKLLFSIISAQAFLSAASDYEERPGREPNL